MKSPYWIVMFLFVGSFVFGKDPNDPNYSIEDGNNIDHVIAGASSLPEDLRKGLLDYFNRVLEESRFGQSEYIEDFPEFGNQQSLIAYRTFRVKTEDVNRFLLITSLVYNEAESFCRVDFIYNLEEESIYHERFGHQIVYPGTLVWRLTEKGEWKISPREAGGVIGLHVPGGVPVLFPHPPTDEKRVPLIPTE